MNHRLPSQIILYLDREHLLSLFQLLRHALESSGWLRALLVVGDNLERCQTLQEIWYKTGQRIPEKVESGVGTYPVKTAKTPNRFSLAEVEVQSMPNASSQPNYPLGKPQRFAPVPVIALGGVETSILALSSHLNVWIQVELEQAHPEKEFAAVEEGNEPRSRVSVVFDPEAIVQLLRSSTLATAVPHCSGLEAVDLENDERVLRRFWLHTLHLISSQDSSIADAQESANLVESNPLGERTAQNLRFSRGREALRSPVTPQQTQDCIAQPSSWISFPNPGFDEMFWDCPTGIVYHSIDGGIVKANPAFCQMTGYSPSQLRYLDSRAISYPEDFAALLRLIQQMVREGVKRQTLRQRYICANGSLLAAEVTLCLVGEEEDESYFMTFVTDLSDRARAEQEIQQRRSREMLLSRISAKIRSTFDLPTILKLGVQGLRQALDTDRALAFQFLADGSGVCIAEDVQAPYPSIQGQWLPADCMPLAHRDAYRNGHLGSVPDIQSAALSDCYREMLNQFQVRSFMGVAIGRHKEDSIIPDNLGMRELQNSTAEISEIDANVFKTTSVSSLWGLLVVHHCHGPRQWTTDEKQLVQAVATQMAIAIEQANLVQQLRTYARELEDRVQQRTTTLARSLQFEQLIRHLTETLSSATDENSVISAAVQGIVETLGVDSCHALLWDEEQEVYQAQASFLNPLSEKALPVATRLDFNQLSSDCRTVLLQGEPCVLDAVNCEEIGDRLLPGDENFHESTPNRFFQQTLVPIADDSGSIGALGIIQPQHKDLDSDEIELVKQVAKVCAIAIRQARLLRKEQSSRLSADYFRSFLRQSSDIFVEYDTQLRYLSINAAGAAFFGLTREQIIGKTNQELSANAAEAIEPLLCHVYETGDRVLVSHEINFPIGNKTVETVYSPISDETGAIHRIIAIARDVSEFRHQWQRLQEQNQELAAINRLKEEFIATTSHELRTPLTAILGFSSVLLEESFGSLNGKQKIYLDRIHTSGQHLLSLINDILDLSRIEADRLELEPQLVYICDICQGLVSLIQERVANHGLQFQMEVDPSLECMVVDPRRIKQMLLNLLTNAIKFTPEGEVGLKIYRSRDPETSDGWDGESNSGDKATLKPARHTLTRPHDWIHFVVWDTGIGIDERDRPRLFSPFSQIDSSLTRKYQGSGLGLAITRKLVELHGGWISVSSHPNQGSTFSITLPLYESATEILLDALKNGTV
ncbi:ATP-binding protein [Laspinema palackyanum]|uniref:ATP-binding protein n=1 Tax=Laspinema palackyanum TaxID=3231601 RepID=UPI00345DEE0F|nr:ATP-binding protein [Laspinema sp. D2c]